jgi:high-affinity iron transporter
MRVLIFLFALLLAVCPTKLMAAEPQDTVQMSWRLLDYVAVDYSGAVKDGRVLSASEFDEMKEFTATVEKRLSTLPPSAAKASLLSDAAALRSQVDAKAAPFAIAAQARRLGSDLLKAYPVPLGPPGLPDLARGNALFQANCAACHGATSHGDGPAASTLDPKPVNFTDRSRAQQRSIFALEQVIDQGIDGTAMQSFSRALGSPTKRGNSAGRSRRRSSSLATASVRSSRWMKD